MIQTTFSYEYDPDYLNEEINMAIIPQLHEGQESGLHHTVLCQLMEPLLVLECPPGSQDILSTLCKSVSLTSWMFW